MEKPKRGKARNKRVTLPYSAALNESYLNAEFTSNFKEAFVKKEAYENEKGATLHKEPFQCAVLPSFLQDSQILDRLKQELLDQIFFDKNNDLYKFQQSDDLKTISTPHVKAIRKFFCDDVAKWLRDVTGIALNPQVDLTCSRYDYTDTLLCHDDELDTRRIAFILYLVPPWKEADGGALDLFDMDEHGQPKTVVKSIFPAWNSFAWFEVTEASHHQVAEVLSRDKTRLSVNGWFHAPPVPRPERYIEPSMPLESPCDIEEAKVYEWINPVYLEADVQGRIQEKFENDSEIELQGFLQEEKYHELLEALKSEELKWQKDGVPNKRNCQCLNSSADNIPTVIRECQKLLRSEAMFLTLSNLTGLSLHPLAVTHSDSDDSESSDCEATKSKDDNDTSDSGSEKGIKRKRRKLSASAESKKSEQSKEESGAVKAKCRSEIRKWQQGCYTLVHDTDSHGAEFALDAMLFCGCKGWKSDYGGSVSYIAKGEDDELLSVSPAENSLALVYRDKETLRFVKHVNQQIQELPLSSFFDISYVYYE